MNYTCIDSFSGAGGLSLGLLRANYEILLSFDNDPKSVATQSLNRQYFQHPTLLLDVEETLQGALLEMLKLEPGELFLLAGGPPCQGFSVQRIGADSDIRNNLVLKFMALVEELRPSYFLMENVPGITGKRGRRVLKEATKKASELGYWIHKATLDAQDFGVPQRRKRLFVVGEKQDGFLASFRFPQPTTPEGFRLTVSDVISHLPRPPMDGSDHPAFPHHRRDMLSDLNKKRLRALKAGQGREHLPDELLAECHRRDSSEIGHRNVYGRMSWDEVAPTITARFDSFTRGQFGHPEQVRSISLREGALLQTFPEDFVFAGNKVDIARQIGNAVPPLLAEVIGTQIVESHRIKMGMIEDEL